MSRAWLPLALSLLALPCRADGDMSEIFYRDVEADGTAYNSRIMVYAERLRMDSGRDDDDYILYDRPADTVYAVSVQGRSVTVIQAGQAVYDWPETWRLEMAESNQGANRRTEVRLNGAFCAEFKNADLLPEASRVLAAFPRVLAASQAAAWQTTPPELRDPCFLAIDVREAGIPYRHGLLLAARYADGRSRTYQHHGRRPASDALFRVPEDFRRYEIRRGP